MAPEGRDGRSFLDSLFVCLRTRVRNAKHCLGLGHRWLNAATASIVLFTFMATALRPDLALAEALLLAADSRDAPDVPKPSVIRVGRDYAIKRISDAVSRASSGDVIEVESGEYVADVASWRQNDLTIRAVGGRARLIPKGVSAEDKAIWVIKGNNVLVENFEFIGARVLARNGAGIRHEGGKLTVRNCLFDGNQMGLLTWNNERASLIVEKSEFRNNAVADDYHRGDPIGHQIYVGTIAMFTLTDSYIHHGAFGHLVKSRAQENHIVNNRLTDEVGGKASYELEFPNGGIAYVLGNIIEQSAHSDNPDIVSYGAEKYRWPHNELYLINNTLVDHMTDGGNFVHVRSGADKIEVVNNLLFGNARLHLDPQADSNANVVAQTGDVASVTAYDFRLREKSKWVGAAVDPGIAHDVQLRPRREYVGPMESRSVPPGTYSPGAIQTIAR